MRPFRFVLLMLAWLLAGPALTTEAAPPCNPEAAARFGVVSNTCFFDEPMDAVDEAECADFGANLWLVPFQPLRPERWTGTSMFLYRRNDTIGWVAVGPQCSVRKAVRAHLNEVVELLISSDQLHDVAGEKGPSIASPEDAIWWISELLRAYFAQLVHETGRPLGRASLAKRASSNAARIGRTRALAGDSKRCQGGASRARGAAACDPGQGGLAGDLGRVALRGSSLLPVGLRPSRQRVPRR